MSAWPRPGVQQDRLLVDINTYPIPDRTFYPTCVQARAFSHSHCADVVTPRLGMLIRLSKEAAERSRALGRCCKSG